MNSLQQKISNYVAEESLEVCGEMVTVRGLSRTDRAILLSELQADDDRKAMERFASRMLAMCVFNGSDQPLMKEEQWAAAQAVLTDPLVEAANRVNGFGKDEVADMKKKSETVSD